MSKDIRRLLPYLVDYRVRAALCALAYGDDSASGISKRTGVKLQDIQAGLTQLVKLGYVKRFRRNRVVMYGIDQGFVRSVMDSRSSRNP